MTGILVLTLKLAVGALILAIGMGSRLSDLTYLWRRPSLLLRSLLAMYVVVPAAAFVLAKALPVAPGVKAALLVLAVSAGAPLLPRKLGKLGGSGAFVFSLVVTSSLLAIVLVPAWIALLNRHFDTSAQASPAAVAELVAKAFLLPLLAGMAARALAPKFGEWLADRLLAAAGIVLAVAALMLLVTHRELFLEIRWSDMAALAGLMALAIAIGHALGGPAPETRAALAIACATRHIAVAILVASAFPGPRTTVLMLSYFLASAAVSIPYLRWQGSRSQAARR